jgi:hypothetical protein
MEKVLRTHEGNCFDIRDGVGHGWQVEPAIGAAMLAWTQCQTSVTEENF